MTSSLAQAVAARLVAEYGADAHKALDELLDRHGSLELAATLHDWEHVWARAKQLPPHDDWRSFGFLTGRGFGKTRAISELITAEVFAGRAGRIALMAQTYEKTEEVMIDGKSGLLQTAPPWFQPKWESDRLLWPNGAQAFPYTPEKPGNVRGPEHDLAWLSEIQSWPRTTMGEAFKNVRFGLRLGLGRMVWDATPKRRHKLLRWLVARAARQPHEHVIVRGAMWENVANLAPSVVAELVEDYGGTPEGDEELEGILHDDVDGALWKQEWIDTHRRAIPPGPVRRRILSCDPAISMKDGTDAVGMIEQVLDVKGDVGVEKDHSARMPPSVWGPKLIERYIAGKCDCIVAERDRGGNLVAEIIRLNARELEMQVVVLDEKDRPQHVAGVIYIREVNTQQRSKAERAQPVADRYKVGKVYHVTGAELSELEDELTTWVPDEGGPSPNRLDADVQGVRELLDIKHDRPDRRKAMQGLREANEILTRGQSGMPTNIAALLGRGGSGGRVL